MDDLKRGAPILRELILAQTWQYDHLLPLVPGGRDANAVRSYFQEILDSKHGGRRRENYIVGDQETQFGDESDEDSCRATMGGYMFYDKTEKISVNKSSCCTKWRERYIKLVIPIPDPEEPDKVTIPEVAVILLECGGCSDYGGGEWCKRGNTYDQKISLRELLTFNPMWIMDLDLFTPGRMEIVLEALGEPPL